jgi:predicted MPP superfamily phosphohydrolase
MRAGGEKQTVRRQSHKRKKKKKEEKNGCKIMVSFSFHYLPFMVSLFQEKLSNKLRKNNYKEEKKKNKQRGDIITVGILFLGYYKAFDKDAVAKTHHTITTL